MLRNWQKQMSRYLYSVSDELDPAFIATLTESSKKQLIVYRHNLVHCMLACLQDCFPVTEKILSEQNFRFFVREFTHAHPSQSSDLGAFGEKFPLFLAQRAELEALPWIESLANLEWHWHSLKQGKESYTLTLNHQVFAIWKGYDSQSECIQSPQAIPQRVRLWREGNKLKACELEPSQIGTS